MGFCLQYIYGGVTVEPFIGFFETECANGETLYQLVQDVFKDLDLKLEEIVGEFRWRIQYERKESRSCNKNESNVTKSTVHSVLGPLVVESDYTRYEYYDRYKAAQKCSGNNTKPIYLY